jgi:hypothetical protein
MNAKQICEALLAGKKVGVSGSDYMYLNIEGELQLEDEDGRWEQYYHQIGAFFDYEQVKIIPEEG